MSSSTPWILVVVRAWIEPDGMRIRLLHNDSAGERAERTTGSPQQAAAALELWLEHLRRDPRRNSDAGADATCIDSPGDHGRQP